MKSLLHDIDKKINGVIWSLVSTGVVLVMLSILIVWTDFMLPLIVGLFVLVIAYVFLYGGWKLHSIRKAVKEHFKL